MPEGAASRTSQAPRKRSKVQSCDSCRKHKTRCEILDSKRNPVRCHRCHVLKLDCSYEISKKSPSIPESSPSSSDLNTETSSPQVVYALGVDTRQLETAPPPLDAGIASDTGSEENRPRPVIWSFVRQNLDWSAPILAMQELARQRSQEQPSMPITVNNQLLSNILTQVEIKHLLTLCV